MSETILNVSGVSKRFGGLQALSDVGIKIERGQVYGLIGPNGAGKTTFFNVLTGLYTPDSGTFELAGKPYKPTAVHEVAKAGIARTFQKPRLLPTQTVLENAMLGGWRDGRAGFFASAFALPSARAEQRALRERARELLDGLGLGLEHRQAAGLGRPDRLDRSRRRDVGGVVARARQVDQPQVHFELRQGSKPVDPTPHMERL